jgi:hypothetical protein
MRIIGNIEHPVFKITVFKHDNRVSVKLESGLYEQTYKFRDGEGIDKAEDVEKLLDAPFLESVEGMLSMMHSARIHALNRQHAQSEESFEEII